MMPLAVYKKLNLAGMVEARTGILVADGSTTTACGKVHNVITQVEKLDILVDYLIVDCEDPDNDTMLLGRPFLATTNTIINVARREISMNISNHRIIMGIPSETLEEAKTARINFTTCDWWMETEEELVVPFEDLLAPMDLFKTYWETGEESVESTLPSIPDEHFGLEDWE